MHDTATDKNVLDAVLLQSISFAEFVQNEKKKIVESKFESRVPHFVGELGQSLRHFGIFRVILEFCKFLNILWQKFGAVGHIFIGI